MDPMKILLVDDSKSARYALRLQLQRHGVVVDTADSAESALELLKGELPDAILMDHMMPGLNGFEALEAIREDPRTAHLPVVMCTSHEDADFAATAQRKGVVEILPKSGAVEKLPGILAKLRDSIRVPSLATADQKASGSPATAGSGQTSGRTPPAAPSQPAAPTGTGASAIDEAQILARLDERIASRITHLLDDLRRDLSERLTAEIHRQIDTRLESERQALDHRLQEQRQGIAGDLSEKRQGLEKALDHRAQELGASLAKANQAELQSLADRLSKETLPNLVKVEIEAERGQIMALVEQYLGELAPRVHADTAPDTKQLAAITQVVANKAAEVARREAQSVVEASLSRQQPSVDAREPSRLGLGGVYLAIAAAAITGVGAAAVVYVLLS